MRTPDTLAAVGEDYFTDALTADPITATFQGIPGYDAEVPDASRGASAHRIARLDDLRIRLAAITPDSAADTVTHAALTRTLRDTQEALVHAVADVAVTASLGGLVSELVGILPSTAPADAERAADYLSRLAGLGSYVDTWAGRYRAAVAEGRTPTARGVAAAVAQLDGLLATEPGADPLLRITLPSDVDEQAWRSRAEDTVRSVLRPALGRLRACYAEELAPHGRDDEHPGLCHLAGGAAAYAAAAAAATTTSLDPAEIHRIGKARCAELRAEFAELGGRALGTSDVDDVIRRLRDDPTLRFDDAQSIVDTSRRALHRATEALPDVLRPDDLARVGPCDVARMPPLVAEGGVLGYYLPPAADGRRNGRYEVNTAHPRLRARYEYEALAFHESVPGHHVQLSIGQARQDLPRFRRFAQFTAHVEGWALYTERLAAELGLYSSELHRLGMVSFEAWRAARLVVDTGLHRMSWSRGQAIEFLRRNTALSETNIANEVDRYIAVPGQALAYLIGKRHIDGLRAGAQARLGGAFDLREFHHLVLGNGALPLDVLTGIVDAWT